MRYIIALIILSGCGAKGSAPVASTSTPPSAACSNGELSGSYSNVPLQEYIAISGCQFTFVYGNANTCQMNGVLFNTSNAGGDATVTVESQTGDCGNRVGGACTFHYNVGGDYSIYCASMGFGGEYARN